MLHINQDFSPETGVTRFIECHSEENTESHHNLSHRLVAQDRVCKVRKV